MQHKLSAPILNRFLFMVCLFVMAPVVLHAQSSRISLSDDSLETGEVFSLSIHLQQDKEYEAVVFPDSSAFPDIIQYRGHQVFRVTDFADSASYELQFFTNKDITLPPFQIGLVEGSDTSFIYTKPVNLYFKSVLESTDAELKPIKPNFPFKGIPWPLIIIIAAIIIAAISVFLVLRKRKQVIEPEPELPVRIYENPIETLEKTLTELKEDYDLATTRDFKYFYSSMSDAVRWYFEELYNIPALESTSREVLRYMDAFGVDHEMITYTRHILNNADMVKFAKYEPTLDNAWKTYQFAIDFLDRARIVDASRISRKRSEFEQVVLEDQEPLTPKEDEQ